MKIVQDKQYSEMYRIQWEDGVLSEDMYNISWAKEHLRSITFKTLYKRTEKPAGEFFCQIGT